MNQQPGIDPALIDLPPLANSAAFRRGKILVTTVVLGTALFLLWETVHGFCFDHTINAVSALGDCAFLGFVSWLALRGGRLITGCLAVPYAMVLVGAVSVLVNTVALHINPGWVFSLDLHRSGRDPAEIFDVLTVGWAGFSFWVLLFSGDAHLYRGVRRREVSEAEASAFEWPPRRR